MKLPTQLEPKQEHTTPIQVFDPDEIKEKRVSGEITSKQGLEMFQTFLKRKFPIDRVATLIDNLSRAEDVRVNSFGARYTSPNWGARDRAIDKVLKLLALTMDSSPTGRMAPTKMTFNIISNSPVKVEQKVDKEGA